MLVLYSPLYINVEEDFNENDNGLYNKGPKGKIKELKRRRKLFRNKDMNDNDDFNENLFLFVMKN